MTNLVVDLLHVSVQSHLDAQTYREFHSNADSTVAGEVYGAQTKPQTGCTDVRGWRS